MPKTAKEERREVLERIHEVDYAIAEAHRAWVVDGKSMSTADRATLQAERAALRLRRIRLDIIIKDELAAQPEAERSNPPHTFLHHLIQVLNERDLGAIVIEAKGRMQAVDA